MKTESSRSAKSQVLKNYLNVEISAAQTLSQETVRCKAAEISHDG